MSPDLVDCWTRLWVVWEEIDDEVLKCSTHCISVDFLEVEFVLASEDQVIEVLFLPSFFEGENSLHYDEQDNCKWE